MPAVSVVIPLYNRETLIARAVESVQAQTLADFELIVVDDGSTDGGAAVVAELARADQRLRLVQQANTGAGGARHRGIAEATAPLVAFLDSDDFWAPSYLEVQVGLLQAAPAEVIAVVCNGTAIEPGKADAPLFQEVGYEPPAAPRILESARELWEPFQAPYLQGSVYRREALLRMDAFAGNLRSDEDFEMLVRMSFAGQFLVNPANLFTQDRGRDGTVSLSQSTKLQPSFFEARCRAARFAYEHDEEPALRASDKAAYLKAFRSWMRRLAADGRFGEIYRRLPGVFACGFDAKSVVFAAVMLTGPLGARLWERLSASRASSAGSARRPPRG